MSSETWDRVRVVTAVHGLRTAALPPFVGGLAEWLRNEYPYERLVELYGRCVTGDGPFEALLRSAVWSAASKRTGRDLRIDAGAGFKHLDTCQFGDGVFIGAQSYVQGRFDGSCTIGDHVWIGPQSFFDARDLVIEDYVGWGPGAKVLGSVHTGLPTSVPIIQTDLEIRPVRICAWADIGTNAVVLPGVTIGKGAIVGAGAVVTKDVPPFTVAAGVPARVLRQRRERTISAVRSASAARQTTAPGFARE
jgi:acetyltransferase-like isoleucine patch superfamily enzyme